MTDDINEETAKRALAEHAADVGRQICERYGPIRDTDTLAPALRDDKCVRFPVEIVFVDAVPEGTFGSAIPQGEKPSDGYEIALHRHYEGRGDAVAVLTLYLLVSVNYGDFGTAEDAEHLGAAAMGMERDAYYARVCALADELPGMRE